MDVDPIYHAYQMYIVFNYELFFCLFQVYLFYSDFSVLYSQLPAIFWRYFLSVTQFKYKTSEPTSVQPAAHLLF